MILAAARSTEGACARDSRRAPRARRAIAGVDDRSSRRRPTATLGDLGTPVAFELARRLRKAPRAIAQEICRRASARSDGIARVEAAPNGYLNVFLDRPAFLLPRLGLLDAAARAAAAGRQDHRRAHRDQPEQGRAHRPPAQLRARRHARARAALPRHAGRSPELHRRHRRPGRRRRRRLPRARGPKSLDEVRAHRRLHALRLLLLGSLRARHRVVRARTRSA